MGGPNDRRPHFSGRTRAEGNLVLRNPRLPLLLFAVSLALTLALVWPFAPRASAADPAAPSADPTPSPAPDPLPLFRTPAAVRRAFRARRVLAEQLAEQRVVGFARRFLGVRYSYGGSSPRSGFDCSGFVRYVYAHFGVSLAHSSFADFVRGRRVGRWAMKPGDLVFFDSAGHVGIYVGKGRFIHAPHSGTVVRIETMAGWYSIRFDGARRLLAR
jgi:cell wall-associated NlpC family hydrolase